MNSASVDMAFSHTPNLKVVHEGTGPDLNQVLLYLTSPGYAGMWPPHRKQFKKLRARIQSVGKSSNYQTLKL